MQNTLYCVINPLLVCLQYGLLELPKTEIAMQYMHAHKQLIRRELSRTNYHVSDMRFNHLFLLFAVVVFVRFEDSFWGRAKEKWYKTLVHLHVACYIIDQMK